MTISDGDRACEKLDVMKHGQQVARATRAGSVFTCVTQQENYKKGEDMTEKQAQGGPQFLRFMAPVLEALKGLGGSGRPAEVVDWIAQNQNISDEERSAELPSGQLRFPNEIYWAKFYLKKNRLH